MNPKSLDQKTGSSKDKMERGPHQTVWTHMVKISQAQTPVGSIQGGGGGGGGPLSRMNTNPDDDDDDKD